MYKAQPRALQETKEALSKSASEKLNGEMKKKPCWTTEAPVFPWDTSQTAAIRGKRSSL